jgi:hypothetical protein
MDVELIVWVLIFVGGYAAVLGYLLRIALRKGPADTRDA